ncbi:glycosyltransferase [Lewinella sp. IMCC34191]|uniref:glycosyltransferase n=1 Tax=Lewinella sp. IMCC34191 TaxID=2259172 RepID=UPI001300AD5A|nr:glycosyltransferase [Lewinella sp. IMCC34191]
MPDPSEDGLLERGIADQLPPPHPACRLCITIPAKDEAEFIGATLKALQEQGGLKGDLLSPDTYEVIILANNCTDDTAERVRSFALTHPSFRLHLVELVIPRSVARVGLVRKLMMDEAWQRLPPGGIIATTDADTIVDRTWVAATFRAFERGARAVGGRIVVPPTERTGYRKIHLQDVTYRSLQALLESMIDPSAGDPWPRHFQHYGPSMAVSREAYRICGGMPPLSAIEDAAFAWALERIDVELVHDPAVRVYTSDRDSGRIEGVAFSESLKEWANMQRENRQPVVFGLQHCIDLFKWKVALRRAFYERRIGKLPVLFTLADYLGCTPHELQRQVVEAPSFGALYQDVRQRLEATHSFSDRTFPQAITELRRFTRSARGPLLFSTHRAGTDRPGAGKGGRIRSAAG